LRISEIIRLEAIKTMANAPLIPAPYREYP
jgi:hypothetical protein